MLYLCHLSVQDILSPPLVQVCRVGQQWHHVLLVNSGKLHSIISEHSTRNPLKHLHRHAFRRHICL